MRILAGLLMMLVLVTAVQAEVVLLSEDFDGSGATAGNSINGYNGWSGHDTMVFTDTVIDSGLSAGAVSGVNYPNIAKGFSYTPSAGETYTLTATLRASDSSQYSSVEIDQSGLMPLYAGVGSGLEFGCYYDTAWSDPITINTPYTAGDVIDVKLVVTAGNADCYYRTHGETTWTSAGALTDASIVLANYDRVKVSNKGLAVGGLTDSILLTADVPEPATLSLLAVGSVLAIIRRRKIRN